jgi:hypothetical protein
VKHQSANVNGMHPVTKIVTPHEPAAPKPAPTPPAPSQHHAIAQKFYPKDTGLRGRTPDKKEA